MARFCPIFGILTLFAHSLYLNDVYKIFGILDPLLPPCLHSSQIYSTKFTQPPFLHLHLGTPLPPPCADVISTAPCLKPNLLHEKSE